MVSTLGYRHRSAPAATCSNHGAGRSPSRPPGRCDILNGVPQPERNAVERLIRRGTPLLSGLAGGFAGLAGGPIGAVAGASASAAVAEVLTSTAGAFAQRQLEELQEQRVGAALAVAQERICARVNLNHRPRDDGFLDRREPGSRRSPAEELLEAALRAAAEEHEEQKVPYIGALWANLVFEANIARAYANRLVRLAGQLSWRQYVLVAHAHEFENVQAMVDMLDESIDTATTDPGLLGELEELASLGVVMPASDQIQNTWADVKAGAPPSYADSRAQDPQLTTLGSDLWRLMELRVMPHDDLLRIRRGLRAARQLRLSAGT